MLTLICMGFWTLSFCMSLYRMIRISNNPFNRIHILYDCWIVLSIIDVSSLREGEGDVSPKRDKEGGGGQGRKCGGVGPRQAGMLLPSMSSNRAQGVPPTNMVPVPMQSQFRVIVPVDVSCVLISLLFEKFVTFECKNSMMLIDKLPVCLKNPEYFMQTCSPKDIPN